MYKLLTGTDNAYESCFVRSQIERDSQLKVNTVVVDKTEESINNESALALSGWLISLLSKLSNVVC